LLSGKRFGDQNTLQKAVVQYFISLEKVHCREGTFKLVKQRDKCVNTGKINISM
jgi:hypothetical protein